MNNNLKKTFKKSQPLKTLLGLALLAVSLMPLKSSAQRSENFDEISVSNEGYSKGTTNPRIIGDWSLTLLDASGHPTDASTNFIDVTSVPLSSGGSNLASSSSDKVLNIYGDYHVAQSFSMKTSGSAPKQFALLSFYIDAGTTTWVAEGYLAGKEVVTQRFSTTNLTPKKIDLTAASWQNIDEFRIEQESGEADVFFFLDDIQATKADQNAALPVSFSLFKALAEKDDIKLQWQVGESTAISAFTVERSQDNKTFTSIGTVALSTSKDKINYSFVDKAPVVGLNYYRLKVKNLLSGIDEYSPVAEAKYIALTPTPTPTPGAGTPTTWNLYPNPIRNKLTVTAPEIATTPVTLEVITASGQRVKQITLATGTKTWQLNMTDLAEGIYFLRLRQNAQIMTTLKMIKL